MTEECEGFGMMHFSKRFAALLALDSVALLIAAALLLRSFWQPATAISAALFVANAFLVPSALGINKGASRVSDKGRSKLWFWGFALLAAAVIRSALFMVSGFSWPSLMGVIAGLVFGTLFLVIAQRSKEMTH